MIPLTRGRIGLLLILVSVSLALAAIAAGAAFCVQLGVDALVADQFIGVRAIELALVFVLLAGAGAALEVFRAWAGEKLGLGYIGELRGQLFDHLLHVSPDVLAQRGQGGLLLPFVGDLTALKKWVSDGLVRLISATASTFLLLAALSWRSPFLAMAAGAIVLVGALAVLFLSGPLSRAIKQTRKRRGAIAAFVSRSIRAAGAIRAFNRFGRESKRLEKRNEALVEASLKLAQVSGAMAAIVHMTGLGLVFAALAIGAFEVRDGVLSVGAVVAAISVSGLLAGAVRDLGVAFELWRRASVSIAKLKQTLGVELAVAHPRAARSAKTDDALVLSLREVAVNALFADVSMDIRRGEIVAISGESGAGKSTLLAIAARLSEPDRGRVRVLGRDARDLKVGSLRGAIGFAGAATPLLVGSLAMNLTYRAPNASQEEIAAVIEACELQATIGRLSGGLGFKLSEGAPELSAAERQKLQLARAMLGAPALLVLDEVDKDFDAETASRIGERLMHYPGAIVMAAQSTPWRQRATSTWVIEAGGVRAQAMSAVRLALIDGGASGREGASS
ncbi:ABC transporter transmembrane domain-containing protein [Candidatus Viadribacter manganicus]|uniref:ABC transporter ATP-binding protein n=1 Tax=Candidatus Viadribacter manganicus TaxID=1759059 RepID=A0A1B1AGM3_9PROT|nr:ABC transporter ATP-binding protein [Candidatus Viadribacter manganicus]ANP45704.1 hypothetical protein ATE48_07120 [Candidatus Viadribacter manganicus]